MKVEINYQPAVNFFNQEIKDIADSMFNQRGKIVRDCAKVIKAAVVKNIPDSGIDKPLYVHMKNDVKVRIKDNGQGNVAAIIGGGKETAYKWHLVDNGTTRTKAAHFTDKAMKEADAEMEAITDMAIFKAVDGNGR